MNIRLLIILTMISTIFISCTPEMEDDYLRIDFNNRNEYQRFYSDTSAVLVKVKYSAALSRNSIHIEDTTYTANALYYRPGDDKPWVYYYLFGNDSNITAVKRDGSRFWFRYQDSLLYSLNLLEPQDSVDIAVFIPADFPDTLAYVEIDSVSIIYIDSLNSSAKWYKTYKQWKDEIINYYR
ncbi:MAG: hypothetical protein AB7V07_09265 [Candidatus Delongbacteria bacterium]